MVSPCKFLMKPIKVPEPFDLQKSTNSENKNHDEKEKHSTYRDDEKQNKVIFDLTKSESYVQKHSTCKNDEKENVKETIDLDNSKSYEETDKDVDDEVILDYFTMEIFIPIHDINHWYLFVVRIDNETGEYWDSLGNSAARRSNCKNILKVLDIYFGHMVTKTKKFEDFPVFKPPNCPRQEGTDDCGLHTIKNMMHYGLE
ncbi:hypothetical protein ACLB2K_051727 [Fragaria x ananassa]